MSRFAFSQICWCWQCEQIVQKNLACYCCFYLDSNYTKCVNLAWPGTWDVEVLIPNTYGYVWYAIEVVAIEDEWDQFGEYLVDCLELVDHFVVNVEEGNIKGVEFYFIFCTQIVHIVEKDFTCQWGIAFNEGDVAIGWKHTMVDQKQQMWCS